LEAKAGDGAAEDGFEEVGDGVKDNEEEDLALNEGS
jgi:hypothetical protein